MSRLSRGHEARYARPYFAAAEMRGFPRCRTKRPRLGSRMTPVPAMQSGSVRCGADPIARLTVKASGSLSGRVATAACRAPARRRNRSWSHSHDFFNELTVRATSSSVSRLGVRTRVAQALLCPLELPFELLQSSVGAKTPSVQLGSQKRDPVAVVVGVGLQLIDLVARAHASNSSTEYALCARTSRTPSRPPGSNCHQMTNG